MDKWSLIHKYRRAYMTRDDIPWPMCPDCDVHLRVVALNDQPALRCDSCRTTWTPGTEVWKNISRNLKELENV